jgi:hypothetical protein
MHNIADFSHIYKGFPQIFGKGNIYLYKLISKNAVLMKILIILSKKFDKNLYIYGDGTVTDGYASLQGSEKSLYNYNYFE